MKYRRISILYDGSLYTFKWLKALLWARDTFKEAGIEIDFVNTLQYLPFKFNRSSLSGSIARKHFDILLVAHHHSHLYGLGGLSKDSLLDVLGRLRNQSDLLVWLDTADSTGTTKFDVLPHVDLYLKKQVLKSKERYLYPIWGGRPFCEYYHLKYGIEDPDISEDTYTAAQRGDLHKIQLSWNVGLADLFNSSKYATYARPHLFTLPRFTEAAEIRTFDLQYRGSAWSSAAGWQRTRARELVSMRHDLSYPAVDTKVPYTEYIAEVQKSRSVVSPFGWGEICGRDFEAFAYGATLLKPDMSHLETFPQWYRPYETYIPIDWDFSNFDDVLDAIRPRSADYLRIAQNGQDLYRSFLEGRPAKKLFVEHVLATLGLS